MTPAPLPLLLAAAILMTFSCGRESRTEGRQRRLDTFREAISDPVRLAFDSIDSEADCEEVGAMLREAMDSDPDMAAAMDSIVHAELIDTFTPEEIVYYFWYYFDYAIETGSVRGP